MEIFFSAHGVPESYVEQAGDPYKEEMEQCIGFIMSELRVRAGVAWHGLAWHGMAWHSRRSRRYGMPQCNSSGNVARV